MKALEGGGMDVEVRSFSTLALGGYGQLHASARFIPGQRAAVTHCTGGWVGPKAGLDDLEKKEGRTPDRPAHRLVSILTTSLHDNMLKFLKPSVA